MFFMALAVLALMVALGVAEREKPIWELVENREWAALRPSATYSVLAGISLTLYVWVWPSAVMLIGIFGVFFVIQLCLDYLQGRSPDHVAFVGAVSFGITAIGTLLINEQSGFGVTSFGFLQPTMAALGAAGCLFVAWLARQWDKQNIERVYFPVAVGGLIVGALAVMAIILPDLFDTILNNTTQRILPFGGNDGGSATIAEAAAPDDFSQYAYRRICYRLHHHARRISADCRSAISRS
ncbi:MAG: hypothetical protein U5K37_09400 [Natrialbaceae archaeon]|nr:hypothetical protein [Natrialbaceae archaeon]